MLHDYAVDLRKAARFMAQADALDKNDALLAAAEEIRATESDILAANARDLAHVEEKGLSSAMIDRLRLDPDRIEGIAAAVDAIADLPDPVGEVLEDWTRPNGLEIRKISVPLGVVGVIYESRPNVTADAAALCFKSGNAVLLRGGSEAVHSNRAIHAAFTAGIVGSGFPAGAVRLVMTQDRKAVGEMLTSPDLLDVVVPRGGRSLVERVQNEAKVPVFAHLEGVVHLYLDASAQRDKARDVILNAKMRRTGICGALETLLVDARAINQLPAIVDGLAEAGCELRGDRNAQLMDDRIKAATETDWSTEYLDAILSIKVVDGVDGALDHINRYSSHHTDGILAEDENAAEKFLSQVDSAIVVHNASTQFADGGEFGMGAEIGIATGRFHARGPVGLRELTTYKYQVRGSGQTRP